MRDIVTVRQASNNEVVVAIPKSIRAVISLNAGDRVMMTAREGEIIITPENGHFIPFGRKKKVKE